MGMPADASLPSPDSEPLHWESFYQNYRKPGYIAGYEIVHKLGGGVFGVVFKARKESIGKAYAIKFLKIDDPSVKAQVLHELDQVSLFAQVDHPNLVSIEDKGVVDGIPYIIMGYAGEETLKSRLEEARLSEDDALRVFVQIARGVQALHDHSLIHFDLKPANVFLRGDIARVGDYGLSKLVCESRMSLSFGRGTPYYMAPEMLQRRGDHRSDIYSLGVILRGRSGHPFDRLILRGAEHRRHHEEDQKQKCDVGERGRRNLVGHARLAGEPALLDGHASSPEPEVRFVLPRPTGGRPARRS